VVDTPFINDGADESLRKTVSLLNKIEAKTGSTTITGPVTVSNEVEVTNSSGSPIPVSGSVSVSNLPATQPISGSVSVSNFPATQPVSGTFWQATQPVSGSVSVSNFPATQAVSLATAPTTPVTGTFFQATQPVSLASAPVTPVTDNGGSLTVDGTVTVNDMTSGNAKTKIVDSVGADVSYITAGTAGTPSAGVLSVQGISGGVSLPVSGTVDTGLTQPLTDTQLRASAVLATVTQATATNLRAQAENYQGGTAVGSANPLQVTLANTATNATAVKVDGSAVTQPVSLASAVTTTPQQGTTVASTTFTSTTASSSVIAASATRKGLTVYNAGFGDLYICAGATCTTTSFQLKLVSGDYWECPPAQVTLAHAGVYATAGTAYVTTIT